jgi:hypothetical protein
VELAVRAGSSQQSRFCSPSKRFLKTSPMHPSGIFLGVLPLGQYYDDPRDPGALEVFEQRRNIGCGGAGELGTLSP